LALGAALYAREPEDALAYLASLDADCREVAETGIQIMAIEAIESIDPLWVEELGRSMTPESLFTGQSSVQVLLLAKFFIRKGDAAIAAILEQGGRGEYGGSVQEITRAARVTLFVTATMGHDMGHDGTSADFAWSYAESLLQSPTAPPESGNVMASFLTSRVTWPGGDSTLALQTLSFALDDPQFARDAAVIVWFMHTPEGPKGCNEDLWSEVYSKASAVAAEEGWAKLQK
jgi:hypothetical protein